MGPYLAAAHEHDTDGRVGPQAPEGLEALVQHLLAAVQLLRGEGGGRGRGDERDVKAVGPQATGEGTEEAVGHIALLPHAPEVPRRTVGGREAGKGRVRGVEGRGERGGREGTYRMALVLSGRRRPCRWALISRVARSSGCGGTR